MGHKFTSLQFEREFEKLLSIYFQLPYVEKS